jgi:hypothetical protein
MIRADRWVPGQPLSWAPAFLRHWRMDPLGQLRSCRSPSPAYGLATNPASKLAAHISSPGPALHRPIVTVTRPNSHHKPPQILATINAVVGHKGEETHRRSRPPAPPLRGNRVAEEVYMYAGDLCAVPLGLVGNRGDGNCSSESLPSPMTRSACVPPQFCLHLR